MGFVLQFVLINVSNFKASVKNVVTQNLHAVHTFLYKNILTKDHPEFHQKFKDT